MKWAGGLDGLKLSFHTGSRRSQRLLSLSVPLSRFTSRVGGGSAFFVRPSMMAAFLKTVDGHFDYGALLFALFLAVVASSLVYGIYQALKRGYMAAYIYRTSHITGYVERKKYPFSFWLMIGIRSLMIAACIFGIFVVCFRFRGHGL